MFESNEHRGKWGIDIKVSFHVPVIALLGKSEPTTAANQWAEPVYQNQILSGGVCGKNVILCHVTLWVKLNLYIDITKNDDNSRWYWPHCRDAHRWFRSDHHPPLHRTNFPQESKTVSTHTIPLPPLLANIGPAQAGVFFWVILPYSLLTFPHIDQLAYPLLKWSSPLFSPQSGFSQIGGNSFGSVLPSEASFLTFSLCQLILTPPLHHHNQLTPIKWMKASTATNSVIYWTFQW
jgi:hypothetical protein